MLVIKLSKVGKTNKKMFRLVVLEKTRDPYGSFLENLGSYNPHTKELVAKSERVNYWISKGAQMTKTVNNLLVGNKIVAGNKVTISQGGKPSEKRLAQIKAKADKKASKESAPETPAEAISEEQKEETSIEAAKETPAEAPAETAAEEKIEEAK
ncbi:MAG: 30S ribosomal protein S16 [Patescibacteria group bacterium]|jgi:small subunit ribosomal protein S16